METVIYYFTGTGNSLWAARKLAEHLPDATLRPMAPLVRAGGQILPGAAGVGIVCPVYFLGLPAVVARFAGMLDTSGTGYLFAAVTMGGVGGSSALHQMDGILSRTGKGLDAGIAMKMPGNYLVGYSPPLPEKQAELMRNAEGILARFAGTVMAQRRARPGPAPFTGLIRALMYPRFIASLPGADRDFTVSDACTSCNTCVQVCPVENITLEAGRPVWHHRCESCLACIHACPVEAIQKGKNTAGRARYRHPAVTIPDLEGQHNG
ncbi:MAG: EFR1 family ferrodoxin [Methanomicrobiales archaeon]|nr:EFR1 family ferrodoxin [Methanomicrobiales archaeon]